MTSTDDSTRVPPPAAATWPELDTLRALGPDLALFEPGIRDAGFAHALAAAGAPVPDDWLALLAATDGLVLRNRETGAVVLRVTGAGGLTVVERDGRPALLVGSWWLRPFGYARESIELWIADGMLAGAYERSHPHEPLQRQPFGARPLDVRAMLRFGLARIDARADSEQDREAGLVAALYAERSWGWYLASDDDRHARLVAAGRHAAARAWAEHMAAELQDEIESCTRAGEHGAASKAERARDTWLACLSTPA